MIGFTRFFTGGRKENGNGPSLSASRDPIGQSVKISNPFLIRWAAITPNNKLINITILDPNVPSKVNSKPNIVTFHRHEIRIFRLYHIVYMICNIEKTLLIPWL